MFESSESRRRIGRLTWVMAWVALVGGQLHALARFATDDGKADLDLPATGFWAEPAGDLLQPLLDWASPDVVYLTYGKLWLLVFVTFTLAAFAVRATRTPTGVEKWGWRLALTGYVGACAAVFLEYWTMWTGINDSLLDAVFLASMPVMLLTMVGSTVLGIALIRRGFGLAGWLLALSIPGMIVIPQVTSLGNVVLPIAFAFGILGRRMAADRTYAAVAPVEAHAA